MGCHPESVKKQYRMDWAICIYFPFAVESELKQRLAYGESTNLQIRRELKIVYRKDNILARPLKRFLDTSQL